MSSTRADLPAPRWLVHLLRSTPVPIPWARAVRAAIALAVPIAIGFALDELVLGALVSSGALPTVLADAAGPYRYRAVRLAGAAFAAVVGFGLGLLTGGNPAFSIPLVVAVSAVSALISAAGNNASIAALQLFVFTVLGTGQHSVGTDSELALACFAGGAVWGLLVALVGWTVHATSPERQAVAQVFIELAALHSAQDEATALAARQQLTASMNTAYDRLLNARSWLSGRDVTYRKLLNLLSAATPAVEACVAMVNAGLRAPRDVIEYFTDVATAVLANGPLPDPPRGEHPDPAITALYHGLAKINTEQERQRRERVTFRARVREWLGLLSSGPLTWIAALRLTLCVTLAELVSLVVPVDRSYWITLTVGIVLKPDFGSVFGRAILRGLGTIVGVGIGAAVLGIGTQGIGLVLLVGLFAAGAAIGKVRNYGILSAFVTPLIIVQMDLTAGGDWPLVLARLVDTVIGCVIVLVFGYLLWPGSRRPRVGGRLADVAETVGHYVETGLSAADTPQERTERSRNRRRAYRGLADLRTAFQQLVVEPSPAGRQAAAWWPAIVALEQLTDAVTAVVVTVEHGARPPAADDVRLITEGLGELAAAVREQRDPAGVDLPAAEELSDIADQLENAFDAVRGPDLTRSRFTFRRRG
ncbi:FUSC family protein [Prauserella cavernicola]|uniref:FUSC family protein n=1 Tax=Prauserella cavernicola TaxID=2800127 RepID=A0A934QN10_9PSEU|nr:FUSC family protein [Prauserella cavernicola]MBK1784987.1 FUSC family protein [Prauserella cavernicola]